MDTSETYIKMSDCPEIQEQKKAEGLEHGDYIYAKEGLDFWFYTGKVELLVGKPEYRYAPMGVIFIPRQDDLQEASGLDWRSFDRKCLVYEHPILVPTKEQAGIRVVMKERYNKVWANNEWRNGSES